MCTVDFTLWNRCQQYIRKSEVPGLIFSAPLSIHLWKWVHFVHEVQRLGTETKCGLWRWSLSTCTVESQPLKKNLKGCNRNGWFASDLDLPELSPVSWGLAILLWDKWRSTRRIARSVLPNSQEQIPDFLGVTEAFTTAYSAVNIHIGNSMMKARGKMRMIEGNWRLQKSWQSAGFSIVTIDPWSQGCGGQRRLLFELTVRKEGTWRSLKKRRTSSTEKTKRKGCCIIYVELQIGHSLLQEIASRIWSDLNVLPEVFFAQSVDLSSFNVHPQRHVGGCTVFPSRHGQNRCRLKPQRFNIVCISTYCQSPFIHVFTVARPVIYSAYCMYQNF